MEGVEGYGGLAEGQSRFEVGGTAGREGGESGGKGGGEGEIIGEGGVICVIIC